MYVFQDSGNLSWEEFILFGLASFAIIYLVKKKRISSEEKFHANPHVQHINRTSSHVALFGFNSDADARKYVSQPRCSPFVKMLNGKWQFRLFNNVEEAFAEVTSSTNSSDSYESLNIPGHWQLQCAGDAPIYTNVKYIIPVNPPQVPHSNPTGYHRINFSVSKTWSSRKIFLHFGAVDNCLYCWCNGHFIGFSKDSRLPAEFDVSSFVKIGNFENTLEVVVLRYSDGYYLEDQDMFNLSGIFRDVFLYSLPLDVYIQDFSWKTQFDSTTQVASVEMDISLQWNVNVLNKILEVNSDSIGSNFAHSSSYLAQLKTDWILCCSLYDEGLLVNSMETNSSHTFLFENPSSSELCSLSAFVPLPNQTHDGVAKCNHILNLNSPNSWSAERPHIYTLVISLKNSRDNSIVQAESCRLGFVTVDISNGLMRVNQRPVMIRGVNLHEHDPISGHAVSPALLEADIKLMKRNNFNAIRTSHYPHSPWLYELCSLYGMFVIDEANIETHGMKPQAGDLCENPNWEEALMQRVKRMYERDKVHPCIIAWSLGNESGYGAIHDAMATFLRKTDPSRLVIYEPASYGPREENPLRTMATDILCPMYARIGDCIKLANIFPDIPLILCEYGHMMGNSGGNLDEDWKAFRRLLRLQGGFIWDWVDQGISLVDSQNRLKWAYGGDFGEVYHDGNFCLNGLNWPDRGLGKTSENHSMKWGQAKPCLSMSLERHIYGCQGTSLAEESVPHALLAASLTAVQSGIDVDGAVNKPCLIEAKQCMKCFECSLVGIKLPSSEYQEMDFGFDHVDIETVDHAPVLSSPRNLRDRKGLNHNGIHVNNVSISDFTTTPDKRKVLKSASHMTLAQTPSYLSDHMKTFRCSLRFSIMNTYDHIDDIQNEVQFVALLLCDGIIVADSDLRTTSSEFVHRLNSSSNEGTGRHSIQEIECESMFEISLFSRITMEQTPSLLSYCGSRKKDLLRESSRINDPLLFGISWPEQSLLDAYTLDNYRRNLRAYTSPHVIDEVFSRGSSSLAEDLCWTDLPLLSSLRDISSSDSTPMHRISSSWPNNWSVIVVGRLSHDSVWAPCGFPLGFVQMSATKLMTPMVHSFLSSDLSFNDDSSSFWDDSIEKNRSQPSVTWVSRIQKASSDDKSDDLLDVQPNILMQCSVDSRDILTRNAANNDSDVKDYPKQIQQKIVINGATGMLEEIWIHDRNILASTASISHPHRPCRVHMHRACTDNDRGGYLASWEALGMNKEMIYQKWEDILAFEAMASQGNTSLQEKDDKNDSEDSLDVSNDDNSENKKELFDKSNRNVPLVKLPEHILANSLFNATVEKDSNFSEIEEMEMMVEEVVLESKQNRGSLPQSHVEVLGETILNRVKVKRLPNKDDGSVGISCQMLLTPSCVDLAKLAIIKEFNTFFEDPSLHHMSLTVYSYDDEKFVHKLAAANMFGRNSVLKVDDKGRKAVVKIWRPQLWMCSTVPRADSLHGPLALSPDDKRDNRYSETTEISPAAVGCHMAIGSVWWEIQYWLHPNGEVCGLISLLLVSQFVNLIIFSSSFIYFSFDCIAQWMLVICILLFLESACSF